MNDNFAWVDDLARRWPVIMVVFGLVAWMTAMQWKQEAMAADIRNVPDLTAKVDDINNKLDALLQGLGYEVRLSAIKKEAV